MIPTKRIPTLLLVLLVAALAGVGCAPEGEPDPEAQAEAMAEQHQGDLPEATALVMEPQIPVRGSSVEYNLDGDPAYVGYLAAPVRPDSVAEARGLPADSTLPAVLLIHEWWGLNDNITATARRLAGEGYRVLAVDLYGGQVGTTPGEAQALMGAALKDPGALTANLQSGYQYLTERYDAPRVAVLGWCFGGMMSLRAAVAMPLQLDATVVYYGPVAGFTEAELATLEMPILAFFGGQDQSIPLTDVRTFEQTLDTLGKTATVHVYDDAGHAFANPSGRNYAAAAATDAWDKTTAFLLATLYGPEAPPAP